MIVEELARFVLGLKHDDIPAAPARAGKAIFSDTIGCCFGGVRTDLGRLTIALCSNGARESSVVGATIKTSAPEAAFANAVLCNIIDYNDVTLVPVGHVSSEVVPCGLAAAELAGASGRELLTAMVAGYEVAIRVGLAIDYSSRSEMLGPVSLPTYHIFGATAAAGRLLGLDQVQLANALAIAATFAMMPANNYVSAKTSYMLKSMTHGVSARNAMTSVLLAQRGLDAPLDFFETTTTDAFWRRVRSDRFDRDRLTGGLGAEWLIEGVHLKAYPSCGWTHGATTAVDAALGDEPLDFDQVDEVRIETFRWAVEKDNRRPRSMADAIFSTPYAVAMTLLRVPRGPAWYSEASLKSAEVQALMDKIVLVEDPEATRAIPARQPTRATIKLRGRTLAASTDYMLGAPNAPMSESMKERKFLTLAQELMGTEAATSLSRLLGRIEVAATRTLCDAVRAE